MRKTILLALLCGCGTGVNPQSSAPSTSSSAALISPCGTEPESRALLASATSREAFLVRADGTKVSLWATPEGVQAWVSTPLVKGRFAAMTTSMLIEKQYASRVTLFDLQGRSLASVDGAVASDLSAQGVVAASAEGGGLVLLREGEKRVRKDLSYVGGFGPNGLLPVWAATSETEWRLALYDVEADALIELPLPMYGWGSPAWSGEQLVYLGEQGDQVTLVRFGGGQTQLTPLVGVQVSGGIHVESVVGSKAVLVTGAWVQSRSTVDLETGAVTPLEVEAPAGLMWAGRSSPLLAEDGSLIAAFRAETSAGLFRSTDGKSWAPMGTLIDGASWLQYAGRGGSWLVTAGSMLSTAPSTVALAPQRNRQVALPRLASGAPQADALSEDGRCAAVWHAEGNGFSLTVADLATGTQREVIALSSAEGPSGTTWIP
jgi:hypothetical protein